MFNIKGNSHRAIVAVAYQTHFVYIKFIGAQAEYDKVDVGTVELDR